MKREQAASHLVIATPGETFIAIQNDPGRLPFDDLQRIGSRIQWLRADGGTEFIDLTGSPSEQIVLDKFESPEGLLFAVYQDLSPLVHTGDKPLFFCVSSAGVIGPRTSRHKGGDTQEKEP